MWTLNPSRPKAPRGAELCEPHAGDEQQLEHRIPRQRGRGCGPQGFIQIESAVNFDAGTTAGSGPRVIRRWVAEPVGQALLGNGDSPYKFSTQRIDPTNDTGIAASTGILGGTAASRPARAASISRACELDRRVSNVVQYWTPAWNGLTGRFAYGAGDTNIARQAPASPKAPA